VALAPTFANPARYRMNRKSAMSNSAATKKRGEHLRNFTGYSYPRRNSEYLFYTKLTDRLDRQGVLDQVLAFDQAGHPRGWLERAGNYCCLPTNRQRLLWRL
jgi:hypothetical protein